MPKLQNRQVTMEDVARACGVTKKTVSRVFSQSPSVKASTREKILEAAKKLHYEFNTLAQNFGASRSRFIGIATAFNQLVGTTYFGELIKGCSSILNDSEWDVALFDTNTESFNNGEKLAKLYRQRRVDGLLVISPHTYDKFLATLEQKHVPMIVVGVQPSCANVPSVSANDTQGVTLLCEHLYSLGHRRIAFISGPPYVTTSELRKQAFVNFCETKQLAYPENYIQPGNFSFPTGKEAARRLLMQKPAPTAIIAANDLMAFGAIASAAELGLRVPKDLSVAGFDDLPLEMERIPTLTTIHHPVSEMGSRSAGILLDSLRNSVMPTSQVVLDISLKIRDSTGPVPVRIPARRRSKTVAA